MANRVGQQLGNYRLIRLLGEGGFAEVYLGEHIYLNTLAAVKVLHTQLAGEDVEGFRAEARTIARLEHPHIVRVLEFGIEGTIPFLVMSYAPNGTLRQSHPKGVPLPLETIVSYTKQVADALQYAHDEKLIHRDIKPENMLLGRRNEVLLSDFGIALVAQSSRYQNTQNVIGTVAYMAPEQLQGKPRPASDQYALGIVVYEWLSGNRPFHGSFTEMYSQHMFVPPLPLREKLPAISPDIELVVLTALAKDPQRRFPSVSAFAAALEQAYLTTLRYPLAPPSQPLLPTIAANPPSQFPQATVVGSLPSRLQTPKHRLSRRTVLASMAGLAVAGGGLTLLAVSRNLQASSSTSPRSTATSPRSTPSSPRSTATATPPTPLGTTLYTFRGHSDFVWAVAWSPNGKRIASGSDDSTVQVWDATNGSNVYIYREPYAVYAVAWSPNGKRIASGSRDSTVQVWDATDGGNVYTYRGHSAEVHKVAWSPNGERIASCSRDGTVQVWDATNGGNAYTYRGHTGSVEDLAWSPNGQRIASAGGTDSTVQVWDATNGGNVYIYHGQSNLQYAGVTGVAWSPNGQRIASMSDDQTVQVWDAADGGNVFTYQGHANGQFSRVTALAWSPNSKRIASISGDHLVEVWDAADGGNVFTYREHAFGVFSLAWSSDGTRIASGSGDHTVQIWQAV